MKYCEQDILKTIYARALKLGELTGDNEQTTWLKENWIAIVMDLSLSTLAFCMDNCWFYSGCVTVMKTRLFK